MPSTKLVRLALLMIAGAATLATADTSHKVKYVPPEGFAGFKWGALRSTFEKLPKDPLGVGAAFGRPVEKGTNFICKPVFSETEQGCDLYSMIMTMSKQYEGGGFYVMSEYTIEGQGFRFGTGEDAVLLHPVV